MAHDGQRLIQILFKEGGQDETDDEDCRVQAHQAHPVSQYHEADQDQNIVQVLTGGVSATKANTVTQGKMQ